MTPRQTITPFSVFRRVQAPQISKLDFTPLPSSIILTLTLQLKQHPNQLENRQLCNRKKAQRTTTNRLKKSQLPTMCFLMGRREKLTIVNGLGSSQPALARIKPMVAMRNKKKTLSLMIPKRVVLADNGNSEEIKRRLLPSLMTHITTTTVVEVVRITMMRATTEPRRLTNQSLVASAVCSSS